MNVTEWDIVDYLLTEADIEAYWAAVIDDGDEAMIDVARTDIARARARWSVSPAKEGSQPT